MYQNFTKEYIQGCFNHKYVVERVRITPNSDPLNRMTIDVAILVAPSEIAGSIPIYLVPHFDNYRQGNGCMIYTFKGDYKAINAAFEKAYDDNADDRANVAIDIMLASENG